MFIVRTAATRRPPKEVQVYSQDRGDHRPPKEVHVHSQDRRDPAHLRRRSMFIVRTAATTDLRSRSMVF
jgi:hypothetical protein